MTAEQNDTTKNWLNYKTILLIIQVFCGFYWFLVKMVDVYDSVVLGAIFEMLWLPMLTAALTLPIVHLILWIREGGRMKSILLRE